MNLDTTRTRNAAIVMIFAIVLFGAGISMAENRGAGTLPDHGNTSTQVSPAFDASKVHFGGIEKNMKFDDSIFSKRFRFDDKRGRGRTGLMEESVSDGSMFSRRLRFDDRRGRDRDRGRTG